MATQQNKSPPPLVPAPQPSGPPAAPARNVPQQFRAMAARIAGDLLTTWVGEERAKEAVGRISAALSASAAAARDPQDFYDCTPASIATCVAIAALTGIMPSTGPAALAYIIPQRPRKGEAPQLQYSLSHRGLNALARRCGQTMIAVPIGVQDEVQIDGFGQAVIQRMNMDDPPTKWDELRGVVVVVRELTTNNVIHRGWVPKKIIEARRAMSRTAKSDYSPWNHWPIEMACKTAMHYSIGRAWCVIDDTEAARALACDVDDDGGMPQVGVQEPPTPGRHYLRQTNGQAGQSPAPSREPQQEPEQEPETGPDEEKTSEPEGAHEVEQFNMRDQLLERMGSADGPAALEAVGADMARNRMFLGEDHYRTCETAYQARQQAVGKSAGQKGRKAADV